MLLKLSNLRMVFLSYSLCSLVAIVAFASERRFSAQKGPSDCARCHSCRMPSKEDTCLLNPCTRDRAGNSRPTAPHGPDTIVLGQLENDYLPVPFDHKGHAMMGEMAEGCATCHHNTPRGTRPPKCESCHDQFSAGTDIDKPGLRGAFHQQCLGCHRDWSNETDCEKCHVPKTGREPARAKALSADDILFRTHPRIHEPEGDFYGGDKTSDSECRVIFRHGEHVQRFGLNCVDCHFEPNCSRCHGNNDDQRLSRPVPHHDPCIRCHKDEMTLAARDAGGCDRCHWVKGQPLPVPFDHAVTGWPLQQFHRDKACRDCHREIPFERPSRECRDCHSGWSSSNFDHALTGLALDENHKGLNCEACHLDQKFDQPPTCAECHDDVAYPAASPGSRR